MNPARPHSFKRKTSKRKTSRGLLVLLLLSLMTGSGCGKDVVYQRSISELNQKAQAMINAGDYNGAVSRLEAAHDLKPDEPNTLHNLAIAYQMQGNQDKAIETLLQLREQSGMDKAEIFKSLGIAYEAKADQLEAEAKALEEKPKPDSATIAERKRQSDDALKQAMEAYQQSVSNGVKNTNEIQKQIEALQAKLDHQSKKPAL